MQHQRNPRNGAGTLRPEAVRAYGTMNTLRALEALAHEPHSAPELAARLQIGVLSARRLLQRLQLEGYVVQERGSRRRYHATLRLAVVGRQLVAHAPLPRLAGRWVARLARATACTAHLWVAAGEEVLCVVHAAPAATITASAEPMLRELVLDRDGAAASVLGYAPRQSSVYACDGEAAVSAASVLERGAAVAALGVTGAHTVKSLALVVRASLQLSRELETQLDRQRRGGGS